jgi:Uma2 family endonuclease
MSAAIGSAVMTTDELLAMPQDGMDRWLIRGQLREKPRIVRDRGHGRVLARLGQLLVNWLDRQPEPRGEVLGGEAGVRLRRDPDTTVGIDVVYVGPELATQDSGDTQFVDGVPVLAVEILSPNDTVEEITERVDEYLAAVVPLVWIVDTHYRTVLVYRPDAEPVLFNVQQDLSAQPHLPGFRVPLAQIFNR